MAMSSLLTSTVMSLLENDSDDGFGEATTRRSTSRVYPLCTEFFCDQYFSAQKIISLAMMLGRVAIAFLIMLLGLKMEKDYMRSITNTIFIPIAVSELFTIYIEIAFFQDMFSQSPTQSTDFKATYINWTTDFVQIINDYVSINTVVCCHYYCIAGVLQLYQEIGLMHFQPSYMICLIMQIVPFFVCILNYVERLNTAVVLKVLAATSRIITIICFVAIFVLIFVSIVVVLRELPDEAATSVDMQIRDARSRLAWTLIYIIIPFITLVPFVIEGIYYIFHIQPEANSFGKMVALICEILIIMVNFYRPTWMVVITMIFLPPYRRAVPLLFCCCSCCPKVNVEPLPRKENESSLMYRYADL
ncbi:Protein CBG20087 [Caenorhabditis briggsae]|uniref:Protein CBG20087 n=2 Tax=Caenorhabditis briggsae TaxID=6238 RepID=A8XX24_CAEBR|nr:Protein CBG20087 [Caenorhabditis briggsae]CAP37193.2 Protein CBG20087 [Caenorhabditis briggsae]